MRFAAQNEVEVLLLRINNLEVCSVSLAAWCSCLVEFDRAFGVLTGCSTLFAFFKFCFACFGRVSCSLRNKEVWTS